MKKFLSIILALIMVISMLPAAFAAVDETTGTITYDFYRNSSTHPELTAEDGSVILESTSGTRSFTNYGTGRDWAYLGSNISGGATGTDIDAFVDLWTSLRIPAVQEGDTGRWVAFKIRVPNTATYKVTGKALLNKNSTTAMDIYIAPLTGDIADTFASDMTYGTVAEGTRSNGKSFSELNISNTYKIGRVNNRLTDTTSSMYNTVQDFVVTQKGTESGTELLSVDLDKDTEYVLIFTDAASTQRRMTPVSLALTIDKTHNYVLNSTVLTGDILNNTAFTTNYRMFYVPTGEENYTGNYLDSYDNVDEIITDAWCVSLLGGNISNGSSYRKSLSTLSATGLEMATRRDMANSNNATGRFVLQLKVHYDGIYNVTADVNEFAYGTDADVYMIKKDAVTEIDPDVLKNYTSIGRVGNVTGKADEDIGAVQLTAGDWYMVFDFNTTNETQTSSSSRQILSLATLTLTETDSLPVSDAAPKEVEEDNIPTLSFCATTNIPDVAKVTVNGTEENLQVLSPEIGDETSVSAPDVTGYNFIGWKCGAPGDSANEELENSAKLVKDLEQEDIFTVYTSTFLTAVYEKAKPEDSDESIVEFWNLDGSYLGSKTISKLNEEGGLPTTSLIGHTFTGWLTADNNPLDLTTITEKITNAVASFTADATLAASDVDCVRVNGTLISDANVYGKEVICEDDNPTKVTHWRRDGKVVSYDPTYKYYVWDTTNISSSYAEIEEVPLVVLDDDTVSDAYMIEYDSAGKTIVEVGILFGAGTPTIESKSEIFKSRRNDNHGQFAAKPSDTTYTARGYMIYKDTDNSYRVIYSD